MLGLLIIAALSVVAIWAGWRGWRLAGLAATVWAVLALVLVLAPGTRAAQMVGVSPRGWAVLGLLGALVLGYRAVIVWARRNPHPEAVRVAAPPSPPSPDDALTDTELDRYARHIVLRELGGQGQRALKRARVLVVGAGGLGAPVLQYLAAAGVGRITVADDDAVGLSNLQRQVIFQTTDIDRPKADSAARAVARLNPHVVVTPLLRRVTAADADLIAGHDLVLDGTDSFASRAGINAGCVAAGVPLIAGSIAQWEGQLALYDPARGGPCLACLFPDAPAPGLAPPCSQAGVVGALPGVIGSMMALEAIKLLAGLDRRGAGQGLRGRMVLFDGLWGDTRSISIAARPGCAVCGGHNDVKGTRDEP